MSLRARNETSDTYRQFREVADSGNITRDDAARMEALDRRATPIRTLTDMREVFSGFHVMVHTLFDLEMDDDVVMVGAMQARPHPIVQRWDRFYTEVRENDRRWEEELNRDPERATDVVRWVHVKSANWAERQHRTNLPIDPPDFWGLWDQMSELGTGWLRHRPSAAYAASSGAGGAAGQGVVTNKTPSAGDKRTRGGAAASPGTGGRVSNPKVHADFEYIFKDDTKVVREAVNWGWQMKEPPPRTLHSPDISYCVPWHTKGGCNANCSCSADHVAQHSDADHAKLPAFFQKHF
jgi:hypothetical protein